MGGVNGKTSVLLTGSRRRSERQAVRWYCARGRALAQRRDGRLAQARSSRQKLLLLGLRTPTVAVRMVHLRRSHARGAAAAFDGAASAAAAVASAACTTWSSARGTTRPSLAYEIEEGVEASAHKLREGVYPVHWLDD